MLSAVNWNNRRAVIAFAKRLQKDHPFFRLMVLKKPNLKTYTIAFASKRAQYSGAMVYWPTFLKGIL